MNFLIYGANGYTGEIIAREAASRGLKPILAGRKKESIEKLAAELGLEFRVFSLEETDKLEAALNEVDFVLHCAGPFSITSKPMCQACLRTGRHYLDITGEIAVFEAMARLDEKAKAADIMIMPGTGFDVVPSDSLALHLKNRLPSATDLTLAFHGTGKISHGTQATMVMNIGRGGAVRRNGEIVSVPAAWKVRPIDFGPVLKRGVTIPWGDVSTAYYSTGIPNIEVYTVVPPQAQKMMVLSRYIGWLLATKPAQKYLQSRIPPGGASAEERAKGKVYLYGEASDEEGNKVVSRLFGPEAYDLTVYAALKIAERIIAGHAPRGFQTPAKAYGADMILEIPGVTREDVVNIA
ncbi:MAG TPA: saccharopine dehydrogenase NADP-binding domain-containing protein [Pyrinomonadaceae bacterium]|jgi:short subunit dehydrogenase-like uncharacterized protein|nr:saccharopine dehydrogenase NADP-binding domain-containing protein [Pyrinomonadaceae bacterium]